MIFLEGCTVAYKMNEIEVKAVMVAIIKGSEERKKYLRFWGLSRDTRLFLMSEGIDVRYRGLWVYL